MDIGIGATLRDARNRRKIELSQVEETTRIRARYLRAIESEDWGSLPGDVYARSFIRTYAAYLGLDGERLADEHRRTTASGERPAADLERVPIGRPGSRVRSRMIAIATIAALIGVALAIGLTTGDGGEVAVGPERVGTVPEKRVSLPATESQREGLSLELVATGEVWVCLLDAQGEPLVNGQILEVGAEEGPFRSGSFTAAFGNGEVSMTIDGEEVDVPATSSPVGYAIDRDGTLMPLAEGERPDCL